MSTAAPSTAVRAVPVAGPRGPGRLTLAALVALAAVIVGVGEWLLHQATYDAGLGGPPIVRVLAHGAAGIALLASGLAMWVARPASRVGPLIYLAGVLFYVRNLAWTWAGLLLYPALHLDTVWLVFVGMAVLWYPMGRPERRDERRLAVVAVGWLVGMGILRTLLYDLRGCGSCLQNPWVQDLPVTYDQVQPVESLVGVALWACFAWFVIRRWRTSSTVARRSLAPVWLSGIVLAIIQVGGSVVDATAGGEAAFEYRWLVADPLTVIIPVALAWGLVRGRLAQSSVGDLVVELGDAGSGTRWHGAIARALGDPAVTIAIGDAREGGGLTDLDGEPVALAGRTLTPIADDEGRAAYLVHDPSLEANPGLVRAVAAATRMALENQRLARAVDANLEEVRASRLRLLEASDAERARMERDLHDGAQQRLVTLGLRLRTRSELSGDPIERATYAALAEDLDAALAELRELARGLHPTAVAQAGLAGAVEGLADRSPVPIDVDIPDDRYPAPVEVAAWFVIAEAVTNAIKHARPTRIAVRAGARDGILALSVRDDGVGGALPSRGSGLTGLADRVAALGGRLEVRSPQGAGTTVSAELPLVPA